MKRDLMLAWVLAAGAMGGLAACDQSSQTPLPDPNVDGVSTAKLHPVDLTILDDQAKPYQERKSAMERAVALTAVPAATTPAGGGTATTTEGPKTAPATATAPADSTAPPTPDATTVPSTTPN
jgi:hypothetical protein